jgi:hypothetical protein
MINVAEEAEGAAKDSHPIWSKWVHLRTGLALEQHNAAYLGFLANHHPD